RGAEDVAHVLPPSDQRVGDQLTVTAPRYGFRAQDRRRPGARQLAQPRQRILECGCLHVVRVAPKAGAAPSGVGRVPPRRTAAAESGLVMVADAALVARSGARISGELWAAARRGIAPHVHDLRDPMDGE